MGWLDRKQLEVEYAMTDYSLLDVPRILSRWQRYTPPPGFTVCNTMGAGCAGDPPGYPTYFLRRIYFRNDCPPEGPQYVIRVPTDEGHVDYAVPERREEGLIAKAVYDAVWLKPPLDHPRTVAWISSTFRHQHHMYQDPDPRPPDTTKVGWSDRRFVFPVPRHNLEHARVDERWRQEFIDAENERVAKLNHEIQTYFATRATPDNHAGTVIVRRHYPGFVPTPDLIHRPNETPDPGHWWARMAECPPPDKCPGEYGVPHPMNGTWCQQCGWHAPKPEETT